MPPPAAAGAKSGGALVAGDANNYEMSDREASSSEEEEEEGDGGGGAKKAVPEWAFGASLAAAIHAQYGDGAADPDAIFPEVSTCDLEEIFGAKKKRFAKRTSSGNWHQDRITHHERVRYRADMGFAAGDAGAGASSSSSSSGAAEAAPASQVQTR